LRQGAPLLDALQPTHLVVMDIAGAPLAAAAEPLARDYPALAVTALGMDFIHDLDAATPYLPAGRRLVYYPGSSIGNFPPDAAAALLARFRQLAGAHGQLLIGFDLKKDPQLLHAAYNDAAGVTAAFNLNLLARLNRELGADFEPRPLPSLRVLQPGGGPYRNASRQSRRTGRQHRGAALSFRAGRNPAYRAFLQIPQ
jgi:L-histidine Nalpha-methyltransferase